MSENLLQSLPWTCGNCGKINQSNRNDCWNCNASQSGSMPPKKDVVTETQASAASVNPTPSKPVFNDLLVMDTSLPKPGYLNFLRLFAGVNLVFGILAIVAFVFQIIQNSDRYSSAPANYNWIVALAVAIEGFLAFGLLNAVADIAENMIDVGNYVRRLKKLSSN